MNLSLTQLFDPQLLVANQGLIVGGLGAGNGEVRFGMSGPGSFADECRLPRPRT
jgi:hypothetical protein